MQDKIDNFGLEMQYRENIAKASFENVANTKIAEIEEKIKTELKQIGAISQIIEDFEKNTQELEANGRNMVTEVNLYAQRYEQLKVYYESILKTKHILEGLSSVMTTMLSVEERKVKKQREDLNTYVSKCQAKWEECYAKYENLPGFQEVRQKQRTLIEVEIKLKSKLLHIDEITQELDQLKIRQTRYSNDANYDNLKILMKPNPSAATKCQTLQYEIDMKQITQKIEHLKTASKALKTVNRNDMGDRNLETTSGLGKIPLKIQDMRLSIQTGTTSFAFPTMVPKVSGGFTNLAFTPTHHNRSQMTMLRGSSASLLSNLGHYVTNTGNMVDGVLKRSDMDTNKYLTSEKCKIKSTSQCFKVISATTDPHSEGIIEEKFETDSVAAAEPRVPNSNGIHSAVIQPSDYSSAIAPNCLQKSSKSDDGHFEIGPKTKSLMSNSIFREATTITPETNVFSTYLHTLPPNVMAEYSNRTSDFMIGQISKFQTSDVSQNSKLNVLSSPNSDNSSSDKSNSLLLAPTNSLPEEKEPQPSKTETFPTPQSLKRQGGELIPTDMENLKLQTRDTECDGIVEPATPKTWRPSNDGPTEVPSRGGFLPNFAHQKNMKMELLDFEHFSSNGPRTSVPTENKVSTPDLPQNEIYISEMNEGSNFLLRQSASTTSTSSFGKRGPFGFCGNTQYPQSSNFFSSHSFIGGPNTVQQVTSSRSPQTFSLQSPLIKQGSSTSFFQGFGKSDSPEKRSASTEFHFNF